MKTILGLMHKVTDEEGVFFVCNAIKVIKDRLFTCLRLKTCLDPLHSSLRILSISLAVIA